MAFGPGAAWDRLTSKSLADIGIPNLHARWQPQVAEALRDLRVLVHTAADERNLALELLGQVDDDLHPVDARRKGGDDDPGPGPCRRGSDGEDDLESVS